MIGGDVVINQMRKRQNHKNRGFVLFPKNHAVKQISYFDAIMLILKASIASDPFLIAGLFKSGAIETGLLYILLIVLSELSFYLFLQSWIYGRAYTYHDLWVDLFGGSLSMIASICVFIIYFVFIIWHEYEVYSNFSRFISSVWPSVPSILTNQWFILYVISIITVIPALFVSRLSGLVGISIVSNFSVVLAMICLIVYYIRYTNTGEISPTKLHLFSSNTIYMFKCIGSFSNSLFFHPVLSEICRDMANPSIFRAYSLTWISTIFSFVVSYTVGLLGYLISPNNNEDNIFYDLNSTAPEVIVGKVATYIVSICSNIFYIHFLSHRISNLIVPGSESNKVAVIITGLTIMLFAIAINFVNDIVESICDLISIIAVAILVYVLPVIFYLKQFAANNIPWSVMAVLLMVVGIPISVANLYYSIILMNN